MFDAITTAGHDLSLIALLNPKLAYILLQETPIEPRAYSMEFRFTSTDPNQNPVTGRFRERFYQDCWVQDITYTLERPEYLPGSPYKPQSDEYCARRPYVRVYFRIEGARRNELIEDWAPLENIAKTISDRGFANRGYVIPRDTNIYGQAGLRRTLGDTEIPYIVTITWNVLEVSGCCVDAIDREVAIRELSRAGVRPCLAPCTE